MAEAAKTFGKGTTIEHAGRKLELPPLSLDMLAQLESWLENRAWEKVERCRGKVPPHVYQERYDAVTRLVVSEAFAFDGEIAQAASRSENGQKYILYLMLASANEDITEGLAAEVYDVDRERAIAKMNALNADPPSPPAA